MGTRLLAATAFVALTMTIGVTRPGFNIAEATEQSQTPQGAAQPQQPSMADMMKMHEQMMTEIKAGDARLDALVKDMNAATGDAKVNAVGAVVNELVRQHKALHGRMGQMHQQMMGMGRGRMMRQ